MTLNEVPHYTRSLQVVKDVIGGNSFEIISNFPAELAIRRGRASNHRLAL